MAGTIRTIKDKCKGAGKKTWNTIRGRRRQDTRHPIPQFQPSDDAAPSIPPNDGTETRQGRPKSILKNRGGNDAGVSGGQMNNEGANDQQRPGGQMNGCANDAQQPAGQLSLDRISQGTLVDAQSRWSDDTDDNDDSNRRLSTQTPADGIDRSNAMDRPARTIGPQQSGGQREGGNGSSNEPGYPAGAIGVAHSSGQNGHVNTRPVQRLWTGSLTLRLPRGARLRSQLVVPPAPQPSTNGSGSSGMLNHSGEANDPGPSDAQSNDDKAPRTSLPIIQTPADGSDRLNGDDAGTTSEYSGQRNGDQSSSTVLPLIQEPEGPGSSEDDHPREVNSLGIYTEDWGDDMVPAAEYFDNRRSAQGAVATGAHSDRGPMTPSATSVIPPDGGTDSNVGTDNINPQIDQIEPQSDASEILPGHYMNSAGRDSWSAEYIAIYEKSATAGGSRNEGKKGNGRALRRDGGCRPASDDQHKNSSDDDEDHDEGFNGMKPAPGFPNNGLQTSATVPSTDRASNASGKTAPNDCKMAKSHKSAKAYNTAEVIEGVAPIRDDERNEEWADAEVIEGVTPIRDDERNEEWAEALKLETEYNNREEGSEFFVRHAILTRCAGSIGRHGSDFWGIAPSRALCPAETLAFRGISDFQSPTGNSPSKSLVSKSTPSQFKTSKSEPSTVEPSESAGVLGMEPDFVFNCILEESEHVDDVKQTLLIKNKLMDWIDLKHTPTADAYEHALLNGTTVHIGADRRVDMTASKQMSCFRDELDPMNELYLSLQKGRKSNDTYPVPQVHVADVTPLGPHEPSERSAKLYGY